MEAYQQLEKEFGKWAGVENTVACSSGTSALQLALETLHLPKGSIVLVPEYTMIACARAVTMAGLIPKFVDCGDDLLINSKLLNEMDHFRDDKVVMAVHIYGRQCNMEEIHGAASLRNMEVIEDSAEAHGIKPHPNTYATCWSFYKNKIVAGEEGGIISFRSRLAADNARSLRCLGFTHDHDFYHNPGGMNAKLSNANASLILGSLRNVSDNVDKRRVIERWYDRLIPEECQMPFRDAPWVYDIRLPDHINIRACVRQLNKIGIQARLGFRPMSRQTEYASKLGGVRNILNADQQNIIYLPLDPETLHAEVVAAVDLLLEIATPTLTSGSLHSAGD